MPRRHRSNSSSAWSGCLLASLLFLVGAMLLAGCLGGLGLWRNYESQQRDMAHLHVQHQLASRILKWRLDDNSRGEAPLWPEEDMRSLRGEVANYDRLSQQRYGVPAGTLLEVMGAPGRAEVERISEHMGR